MAAVRTCYCLFDYPRRNAIAFPRTESNLRQYYWFLAASSAAVVVAASGVCVQFWSVHFLTGEKSKAQVFCCAFSDRTAVSAGERPRAAAGRFPKHSQSGDNIPGGRGRRRGHPEDPVWMEGMAARRPHPHQQPLEEQNGQRHQKTVRSVLSRPRGRLIRAIVINWLRKIG
jgi:hypothetical protein